MRTEYFFLSYISHISIFSWLFFFLVKENDEEKILNLIGIKNYQKYPEYIVLSDTKKKINGRKYDGILKYNLHITH